MAPGIAAQIAQCRDGDDEPFRVNLRENGLGDEGAAKIITSVLANPRVTSLDLASNRITSELGEAVKELLTESEVTELDLSRRSAWLLLVSASASQWYPMLLFSFS